MQHVTVDYLIPCQDSVVSMFMIFCSEIYAIILPPKCIFVCFCEYYFYAEISLWYLFSWSQMRFTTFSGQIWLAISSGYSSALLSVQLLF